MSHLINLQSYPRFFIGIDDTDNLDSRGTGFRVRDLGGLLETETLCQVVSVTRHQLLFDSRIPYTSHNSSACLTVQAKQDNVRNLVEFCRQYLLTESAEGSDAGLCVVAENDVTEEIKDWGRRAKRTILERQECYQVAQRNKLFLQGLTGDHGGVIGALAAVGLRAEGNDGRFIGLRGIREIAPGCYRDKEIYQLTGIDSIRDLNGRGIDPGFTIEVNDWVRPILLDGLAVLLAEKNDDEEIDSWRIAGAEIIKQY